MEKRRAVCLLAAAAVVLMPGTERGARAASESERAESYEATVTVSLERALGAIAPEIYGQYLEHVEAADECIYPSLWDAGSPRANRTGLRTDVIEAVRELGTPVVRWPGGCFADVYHWEDGIGPREGRPVRPNEHWGGTEPNQFGTDEFLQWCGLAGVEPYINVNLGSGTLEEALRWLEYCNGSPETPQGRRRAAHGRREPYGVRFWGIGNETWGPWERGHTDAASYARRLAEWAEALRRRDPSIRILAVGSEEGNDPEWDRTVLRAAGSLIDYLTLHTYGVSTRYDDESEYEALAFTPLYMENRMRRMLRTIDESTPAGGSGRAEPIRIAVDEWNIRHHRDGRFTRRDPRSMQDAIFVAGMLNAMIRLSPRVGMANYVFLVNGNGTLLAGPDQVVRTPLFHVFQKYGEWMKGQALEARVEAPRHLPPPPLTGYPGRKIPPDVRSGEVPWMDAAAARRPDGSLALALINRHPTDKAHTAFALPEGYAVTEAWVLVDEDPHAANSFASPERVIPAALPAGPEDSASWICGPRSVVLLLCAPPPHPEPAP